MNTIRGDGYKYYNDLEIQGFHTAGRAFVEIGKRKIFFDKAVPGDTIDAKVAKRQKGFSIGEILKISKESPNRNEPFCKHSQECGGCNWQHMTYEAQLLYKKQILIDAFAKYEISVKDVPDVRPSPILKNYRNKVDFAFAKNDKGKTLLGFHPLNKPYEVFETHECFLLQQDVSGMIKAIGLFVEINKFELYDHNSQTGILKSLCFRTSTCGELMLILGIHQYNSEIINKFSDFIQLNFSQISSFCYSIMNPENRFFSEEVTHVIGTKFLNERMNLLTFEISPLAFYQPNPIQAIHLYEKIKEFARLAKNDIVYDLYTGAGTIACFLAKDAGKIIGMEGSTEAIEDANRNAYKNGFTNLEFICSDILEGFTKEFVDKNPKPKVIILDPPRSGTLIEIKKAIIYAQPERIIYVSCNPVSLAWDLKQLCEFYEINAIQSFDMFPHTHHLETVVLLEQKK